MHLVAAKHRGRLGASGNHRSGRQGLQHLCFSALGRSAIKESFGAHASLKDHHLDSAGAEIVHQGFHLCCFAKVNLLEHWGGVRYPAITLNQAPHL